MAHICSFGQLHLGQSINKNLIRINAEKRENVTPRSNLTEHRIGT